MSAVSTLLRAARLIDAAEPQDVLVHEGVLVATGARVEHARQSISAPVEEVRLDGRWLLPGLWDHHVHFDQWARTSRRMDVSGARSAAHVAQLVRARLDGGDVEEPLVGYGFRDALWPDTPTAAVLDELTGQVPVILISGDLHCAWLNTAAMQRYGSDDSGSDASDSDTSDSDASDSDASDSDAGDRASGLLREQAAMRMYARLSTVPDEVADRWAGDAAAAAARRGVVGVVDLENPWAFDSWSRRLSVAGLLRVRSGVWPDQLTEAIARGLRTGDLAPGTHGLLEMGPLKVITDGSLNTRTAYCHDPYPADGFGMLVVPPQRLRELMATALGAGLDCAIHAIGDHANSLALQAFRDTGARGSIEHAQLLVDADLPAFGELGIVASVQPEHAMDDRDVADRIWAGRTGRAFMLRSLLDAGARLAFGSDAPVAPLDPWIAMAAAVFRTRDDRAPWHPEQCIAIRQALAASIDLRLDGRLQPRAGDRADLVIVDSDPCAVDRDALRCLPVGATILDGRFTHRDI
jgi:predicted amidohydrolase YtcJ